MSQTHLPEGWELVELGELRAPGDCTLIGGPFGSDLTRGDYLPEPGVPVIRGTNLGGNEGRFIDDGFVYVSEQKANALRRNMAFPGDLIFTQRGTLGQVAVIPAQPRFPRYVISQSQMKLTPDSSKVTSRFLYHYFRTPHTLDRILSRTQATGVPHISLGILRSLPVAVPPLAEQRRIAEVLDRAEALRSKRRAALNQLDTLAQAIFLDLFGDPAANPKGWPIGKIGNLLESASYGTSEKSGATGAFPVLRMNNITRTGEMDLTELKFMDVAASQRGRVLVRAGDVLFNRTNSADLVGKTAVVRDTKPMAYAGYLVRLRVNDENEPEYLSAFLNTGYAKRMLRGMCKNIIGMANINATEVQAMKTLLPPLALQREFACRVAAVEKLKAAHHASRAELDALFASLQHRAFRGEL